MLGFWRCAGLGLLAIGWGAAAARSAQAILFETVPGQVQVVATDATAARPMLVAAETAWRALAQPLELPERFATPVTIRVVPGEEWHEAENLRVSVELPGLVTLWIRSEAVSGVQAQPGVVRALLLRKAVEVTGAVRPPSVPRWLESAAVGWWRATESGSELDDLKRRAERQPAPSLETLLSWRTEDPASEEKEVGAFWLMSFLRSESGSGAVWRRFVRAILSGADGAQALQRHFGIDTAIEGELWWRTGWHHVRRVSVLPGMSAADSRALLADAIRQVWLRDGVETAVSPAEWPELVQVKAGRAALAASARHISQNAAALHPFYRNAALSLVSALSAAATAKSADFALARERFEADWRDATELEAASADALDALEAQQTRGVRVLAAPHR